MKFFNIDLHISVIEDVKRIFTNLGHQIDSTCMSNHTFVFNRGPQSTDVINQTNWKLLNENMCNSFYDRYKDELKQYDGFIVTYPPSFSMLFEKFDKPIIVYVPIRLEVPFQDNPVLLDHFINFLKNGIDNKKIIPVCNNMYDKIYCESYTDKKWEHIPNICDYTQIDNHGLGERYVLYSRKRYPFRHRLLIDKETYLGGRYEWSKFNNIKGVVHFPYNVSTMSIFEQYTGNVPLFFPTLDFNIELQKHGYTLSEISWRQDELNKHMPSANLSDYYDKNWMPYIQRFSSVSELTDMLNGSNSEYISNQMRGFNEIRKDKIYKLWYHILEGLAR